MDEVVFSVIIPHKNTPDLLQRCLDSIPRRKDVQIIIVDDNSDEDKVDFAHFPCMEDEYVEIYLTKEGKGAGYARNVGMTHAKGKWLLFADADDFFTENAFEHFFAHKDSPHEIIYFRATSCFSDTYEPANRADIYNDLVDDFLAKRDDFEKIIRHRWLSPCAKMMSVKLIERKKIRFDEIPVSDDMMFSLSSGHFAVSVDVVNHIVYCITMRKGSLTNRLSPEFLVVKYTIVLRYNEFLRKHNLSKYQSTIVLYYLLISVQYGISVFCKCVKLAYQYKINPFTGITRWIPKYIVFRQKMKWRRGYMIKEK
jgi:glycosyltransferase involved in cell wall biosynthesis